MEVVLILLGSLFAVGLPLWWFDRRNTPPDTGSDTGSGPSSPETGANLSLAESDKDPDSEIKGGGTVGDSECCGMHVTCERDSLLATVSKEIEYYDDEELDVYRGRDPRGYSEEEVEEFRDVLLTLLPDDIAGWARSIQLRGISLPAEVRDELLLIVAESRQR